MIFPQTLLRQSLRIIFNCYGLLYHICCLLVRKCQRIPKNLGNKRDKKHGIL